MPAGEMDIARGGELELDLSMLWILVSANMVFFMQCGFALLEAGTIRLKNTKNILLKNAMDACASALVWWAFGNAFAYGSCGQGPFIGHNNFFSSNASLTNAPGYWALWFFGWAFSATASTIVSGAVAERCRFRAYLLYTVVVSGFIYPVVVHWVWSQDGWLSARRRDCGYTGQPTPLFSGTNGLMDFAGSGVVHMVGGAAALVAATMLGPRLGRFTPEGDVVDFTNANPAHMALGTFILWLGWYGFNSGSTGCVYGCMNVAAIISANTTLAIGAGGLVCLLASVLLGHAADIGCLLNGILAGAVSITASCAMVHSYGAVAIGAIGALVYLGSRSLLLRLKVDDPLDASPVHFFCGAWGVVATGLFATESGVKAAYGYADGWGAFYGGGGKQLGVQLLGMVVIAAWGAAVSLVVFSFLKWMNWLRVGKEDERSGLDIAQSIGAGAIGLNFACFKRTPKDDDPKDDMGGGDGNGNGNAVY